MGRSGVPDTFWHKRNFIERDWLGSKGILPCAYQGTSESLRLPDVKEGNKNGSNRITLHMDLAVLPAMLA
jgi:hypothetical protein